MARGLQLTAPVGARDHARGPDDAAITLVQYGDFECPYSRTARPVVHELQRRYGSQLRYVFRNFPLSHVHPHAQHAAEAAEAAAAQGKFWEMHDYLFAHQRQLDDHGLRDAAAAIGLDTARFDEEMTRPAAAARVHEDVESGKASGVVGTPTFFVNGVPQDSPSDPDTVVAAVERAAGAA